MRINAIYAQGIQPIRFIEVRDMSDIVVFAGPNGVGKTRLMEWFLWFFQELPSKQDQWVLVEATCPAEHTQWGQTTLDSRQSSDASKLRQILQKGKRRAEHESSVLNFDSERSIQQVGPFQFTWDVQDPFPEQLQWNFGFTRLANRFQDTIHSIFRKLQNRRETLSLKAEELIKARQGMVAPTPNLDDKRTIELNVDDFPDPLVPFKRAFNELLGPKILLTPEIKNQQLYYEENGFQRPLQQLSSGEREVVNIAFDFLLRNPRDCIVLFDEPELHLHPELSYKLLQTLKNSGVRNQFIFSTHSADIISAALENTVVFISPPTTDGANQAILVREDDQTHQALKLLGQSIGIVSLGRRIVLIEGEHGSLDKQTYGTIIRGRYPNLVLAPSGGRSQVQSFGHLVQRILEHSIWGIEFFMLCDRDAIPPGFDISNLEATAQGRLRILKRYHLENYFLEENIIASMFLAWEPAESWLVDPTQIRSRLIDIARRYISYAAALIVAAYFRERVGNLDIMPKNCHGKSADEVADLLLQAASSEQVRMAASMTADDIRNYTKDTVKRLEDSLASDTDEWKIHFPGRIILRTFCSGEHANFDFGRFKIGYLKAAENHPARVFAEIESIFEAFSRM